MSQSSKNIVIDRIEGNIAVVEHNGQHHDIPLSILPDGSKEGDVICVCRSQSTTSEALDEASARLERLSQSSLESNDDGSFDL